MSKFENIQVGDIVYVEKLVEYGTYYKYFFVPAKVIKTTIAQFTVEGGNRYQKGNGWRIGGKYGERAFQEGEPVYLNGKCVQDQRRELSEFKHKIRLVSNIYDNIKKIKPPFDMQPSELQDILNTVNNILHKIKLFLNE